MPEGPERIDYRETSDVTEVHGAIKREHVDPRADVTPIPVWLTAVCGVAVCWAGAYLGAFHGGFSPNVFNERASSPGLLLPLNRKTTGLDGAGATPPNLPQMGKSLYSNCQPCHQASGIGVPAQFPPLVGAEWVVGGEKRLVAIILKGMQGPITVKNTPFNGVMPPWEKQLTDKKIAAVASYVRTAWGNNAGEISEAKVAAARKEFAAQTTAWTAEQLAEIPADANLPDAAGSAPPAAPGGSGSAAPAPATTPPAPGGAPAAAVAPVQSTSAPAPAPAAAAPASAAVPNAAALIAEGKKHYMLVCVACHQPTGAGLPPVFPPLTKSEYVGGSAERFAAMILKGNAGPMTIGGTLYNNIMPGQEAMLDDAKIAAIMSYVRSTFGNNAPPVSPALVAATRRKFTDRKLPWTEAELKAWKDESSAPGGTPAGPNPAAAPQNPPIPAAPGATPSAPPTQPGAPGTTPPAPGTSPGSTPAQSAPPAAPANVPSSAS